MDCGDTDQNDMDGKSQDILEPVDFKNVDVAAPPAVYPPGSYKIRIPSIPKRPITPKLFLGRDKEDHYICSPSFSTRPIEEQRRISKMSEELRMDESRHSNINFDGARWKLGNSTTITPISSTTVPGILFGSPILGRTMGPISMATVVERNNLPEFVAREIRIRGRELGLIQSTSEEADSTESKPSRVVPILGRGGSSSESEEHSSMELVSEELNSTGAIVMGRISTEADGRSPILGRMKAETPILGRSLMESMYSTKSSSSNESFNRRSLSGSSILEDSPLSGRIMSPSLAGARRILKARRTLKNPFTRSPLDVHATVLQHGNPILGRRQYPDLKFEEGELYYDPTKPDHKQET